jgi:hypothetical protein
LSSLSSLDAIDCLSTQVTSGIIHLIIHIHFRHIIDKIKHCTLHNYIKYYIAQFNLFSRTFFFLFKSRYSVSKLRMSNMNRFGLPKGLPIPLNILHWNFDVDIRKVVSSKYPPIRSSDPCHLFVSFENIVGPTVKIELTDAPLNKWSNSELELLTSSSSLCTLLIFFNGFL